MATVEVVREQPQPQPPPVKEVVLRLSDEEAAAITAVLGLATGAYPFMGVYTALSDEGYGLADANRHERLQSLSGLDPY